MKCYWLFSIVVAALGVPLASGKTELETLRARCAEMERQIRELEQENSKLREMNGMTAKYPVRPMPASTTEAAPAQTSRTADDTAAPKQSATATTYQVRKGDSWERVARQHGITPKALAEMNGATADSILHEGRSIKVPGGTANAAAVPADPAPRATPGRSHKVMAGDTYYAIGKKYNIPVAVLEAANPNIKATALRPGLVIRLDRPTAQTASAANTPSVPRQTPPATPQAPAPQIAPKTTPKTMPATTESPTPRLAAAATAMTEPRLTVSTPPPQTTIKSTSEVRSVPIMESITYADFARRHGTTVQRLNSLNYLNLPETTILARGAELLVPAQP
jgi:LysM repeat protein